MKTRVQLKLNEDLLLAIDADALERRLSRTAWIEAVCEEALATGRGGPSGRQGTWKDAHPPAPTPVSEVVGEALAQVAEKTVAAKPSKKRNENRSHGGCRECGALGRVHQRGCSKG
jgi:hypothetical protein